RDGSGRSQCACAPRPPLCLDWKPQISAVRRSRNEFPGIVHRAACRDIMTECLRLRRRSFLRLAACAPAMSLATGCAALERNPPIPAALADQVTVLGIQNARFWPDTQGAALAREGVQAFQRERAAADNPAGRLRPANFLAISGGGDDGAFGAGLLCGWADTGKMPSFKLVTGVSTGAMIAPFAFLAGAYKDHLRTLYT